MSKFLMGERRVVSIYVLVRLIKESRFEECYICVHEKQWDEHLHQIDNKKL